MFTSTLGLPFTVICFVTSAEVQEAEATVVVKPKVYTPGLMNFICGLKEAALVPFKYSNAALAGRQPVMATYETVH